tara:strand:- start:3047 stop:3277 length:231 start_codon:yes stop_codon:yes gene_type:complete
MTSDPSFDIRDRIVNCAVEMRDNAKVSGKRIAELQDDQKKLQEYMEQNVKDNQNLMSRFFALVDEYVAIKGGENNN